MDNTRYISYKIIYDIKYNDRFSNLQINKYLNNSNFTFRDRGFITALVYGTLSRIIYLDFQVRNLSKISFHKISKKALVILEMSLYQKYFMNLNADYAIVNEAVKICKREDKRAYKFVNALLRNAPETMIEPDYFKMNIYDKYSLKYSVSVSIVKRLLNNYSEDFAEKLLISMYNAPKLYIRANNLKTDYDEFIELLKKENLEYEVIDKQNLIFSVKDLKDMINNKLYKKGLFSVQDYASMRAIIKMDVQEGDKVLDCCSAPGGKSIFISQKLMNESLLVSVDISEKKLTKLSNEIDRLGIKNIKILTKDMVKLHEEFKNEFDKVLCDVPCSGIGIIRRKPEIRYKNLESIHELNNIQYRILQNASNYVKLGGSLCYSTCTLGKEENDNIVSLFVENNSNYEIIDKKEYYPHIDGTDGFFVCLLKRVI